MRNWLQGGQTFASHRGQEQAGVRLQGPVLLEPQGEVSRRDMEDDLWLPRCKHQPTAGQPERAPPRRHAGAHAPLRTLPLRGTATTTARARPRVVALANRSLSAPRAWRRARY